MDAAAWLDQAELLPVAVLRGRTLGTRAGKSSSWKEEDFLAWAGYAGVMGEGAVTADRLGKSSSFRGARAAATTAAGAADAGFALRDTTTQ